MTTQQAIYIITAAILIFAIGVWTYLALSTDATKLYLVLTKAKIHSLSSKTLGILQSTLPLVYLTDNQLQTALALTI